MGIKKIHTAGFKAKVALEVLKGNESLSIISSRFSVHPTQARRWKDQALSGLEEAFNSRANHASKEKDEMTKDLYEQIGKQSIEINWLKKKMESV